MHYCDVRDEQNEREKQRKMQVFKSTEKFLQILEKRISPDSITQDYIYALDNKFTINPCIHNMTLKDGNVKNQSIEM